MLFLNVYLDGCLDGFNLFYSWNIYNNCIIEDFFFFFFFNLQGMKIFFAVLLPRKIIMFVTAKISNGLL